MALPSFWAVIGFPLSVMSSYAGGPAWEPLGPEIYGILLRKSIYRDEIRKIFGEAQRGDVWQLGMSSGRFVSANIH